jgi:hypothetical protein
LACNVFCAMSAPDAADIAEHARRDAPSYEHWRLIVRRRFSDVAQKAGG